MRWRTRGLSLKQLLLLASMWCLLLSPSSGFSWTKTRWIGVVEATAATVVLRAPVLPSSDICENCSGTGRLGDGVVSVECPVCGGTGKKENGEGQLDCPECAAPAKMESAPSPPGKDGPAAAQDATNSGRAIYSRRTLSRRR
mgnify:CR=1 FL=1